jgi:hypothetical protein
MRASERRWRIDTGCAALAKPGTITLAAGLGAQGGSR